MYCNLNFLQCTVIIETFKNLKEIFHVSDNHEGTEAGEWHKHFLKGGKKKKKNNTLGRRLTYLL